MDFENDKHSRRQLIYYYWCGVDDDGLDVGSGSKNVKTRKSSQKGILDQTSRKFS